MALLPVLIMSCPGLIKGEDAKPMESHLMGMEQREDVQTYGANVKVAGSTEVPTMVLVVLALPEVFHGMILATFLPYLLLMQGPYMIGSAASFMGHTKAVFAAGVLLTPAMGILSDWCVFAVGYIPGRRWMLVIGSVLTGTGIWLCQLYCDYRLLTPFLLSVLVMRLGADIFSCVNEAMLVELVPEEQYAAASGLKGAVFFFGTIFAYILILFKIDFMSLYYVYFVTVFLCVLPGVLVLNRYQIVWETSLEVWREYSFFSMVWDAYRSPVTLDTNFPRVALSIFTFHVGLAPAYMSYLFVQDIAGIKGRDIEINWCTMSIVSLLAAAISSIVFAVEPGQPQSDTEHKLHLARCVKRLRIWAFVCMVGVNLTPCIGLIGDSGSLLLLRAALLYTLMVFTMSCYAVVKAYFQEVAWLNLPEGTNTANTMGFFVACIVTGIGLGSMISGLILERFSVSSSSYALSGYFVVAAFSATMCSLAIATIR
mmetsp:Transcript_94716/g.167778  ORF Transcript_94716/g.167778 Transcript_94716/m.167778 type:complete len:483 (-) Transcript_94716:21-1469(-)